MKELIVLIACALVGLAMVEVAAINKRSSKESKFSLRYYWRRNGWLITWNVLGVIALIACHKGILAVEKWLLVKAGVPLGIMEFLVPPTGIIIGYGGGRLVRKLLNKGAAKVGLEEAFVEQTIEVANDGIVKATTVVAPPPPAPPTDPPTGT